MKTKLSEIGREMARCRKARGLTQAETGAMIGVQKAMVSKIENGRCVNIGIINRLADALGVEPVVELQPHRLPVKEIVDYVMAAIMEFGRRHGLTVREACNYLVRFKGIDFLSEFYDVEHTLSFNDCVEDLTLICGKNGGALR